MRSPIPPCLLRHPYGRRARRGQTDEAPAVPDLEARAVASDRSIAQPGLGGRGVALRSPEHGPRRAVEAGGPGRPTSARLVGMGLDPHVAVGRGPENRDARWSAADPGRTRTSPSGRRRSSPAVDHEACRRRPIASRGRRPPSRSRRRRTVRTHAGTAPAACASTRPAGPQRPDVASAGGEGRCRLPRQFRPGRR